VIVVAPFSNSGIRDWPGSRYAELIRLLVGRRTESVEVIGGASHRLRANEIVRNTPGDRVRNLCGRTTPDEMVALLRRAALVIANNSGVSHLAARLGRPTVSIFAGTHNRREWRALGPNVVLVTRAIGCSPCQLDHGQASPYDKACLREIAPEAVLDAALRLLDREALR
jgi:ADP-heptose:LPS heptosyltransferase